MSVFGNLYSRYYDLLYRDKDYRGEVDYIVSLIRRYQPSGKTVLDLGCGTGRHAALLVEKGYVVHGVERSEDMLAIAKKRVVNTNNKLRFTFGDICSVQLDETFDVAISLFHVLSYQTTNEEVQKAFHAVYKHVNKGGIFIFDFWYGPAVLTERPTVRIKKLEDEELSVYRIAIPVMHPNENVVDVNYDVIIEDKKAKTIEKFEEIHRMRYLFLPELEFILKSLGFEIIDSLEWMSLEKKLSFNTWNGVMIVQK